MTRTEYLSQLDRYLKRLPKADYQEAMDYFTEYFDEAGPEQEAQVISELGSPKEAASELLWRLVDEKEEGTAGSPKRGLSYLWIGLLALLASPIAFPILLVILAIGFSMVLFLFAMLGTVVLVIMAGLATGASVLYASFAAYSDTLMGGLFGSGLGLIGISLSILLLIGLYQIFMVLIKAAIALIKWLIQKGRRA